MLPSKPVSITTGINHLRVKNYPTLLRHRLLMRSEPREKWQNCWCSFSNLRPAHDQGHTWCILKCCNKSFTENSPVSLQHGSLLWNTYSCLFLWYHSHEILFVSPTSHNLPITTDRTTICNFKILLIFLHHRLSFHHKFFTNLLIISKL